MPLVHKWFIILCATSTLLYYVVTLGDGVDPTRVGLSKNKEHAIYSVLTLKSHTLKEEESFLAAAGLEESTAGEDCYNSWNSA